MSAQSDASDSEVRLRNAAKALKDNELVAEFLEAFKADEETHIGKFLSKEDFNLRSAALCAEAYSVAQLMLNTINE